MRNIKIALFLFWLSSIKIWSQQLNVEMTDSNGDVYLIGKIDKMGLEGEKYSSWFLKNYNDYQPNTEAIANISPKLKEYTIKLFMGTWCGDSKREVPRFYKILDACNFPLEKLTVIALSRESNMYKQSPQHEEAGLNIHRVPTFIFYKNGKEVNRIVEHPVESLEQDMKGILGNNKYKSNYQIVTAVDNILNKKGITGLKRQYKKLVKSYNDKVTSMFELNTYGKILIGTNRMEDAIAVYELNTLLFPNEPRTYMSWSNYLAFSGNKEKALEVLVNAIQLFPDNEDLKENFEVIKSN